MKERVTISWGSVSDTYKRECRNLLREAMRSTGMLPNWKESAFAEHKSAAARPTCISFNGRKLFKADRLPDLAALVAALQRPDRLRHLRGGWSYLHSAAPALLFAIFPKCPICWAAYASLLSYLGVYIPYYSWLIWIFAGFGGLSLALSLSSALKTKYYSPLGLLLVAYSLVILNRLYWNETAVVFLAMALLLAATFILKIPHKPFHLFKIKLYGN